MNKRACSPYFLAVILCQLETPLVSVRRLGKHDTSLEGTDNLRETLLASTGIHLKRRGDVPGENSMQEDTFK